LRDNFAGGDHFFAGSIVKPLETKDENESEAALFFFASPRRHGEKQKRTAPLASLSRYDTSPASPLSGVVGIDRESVLIRSAFKAVSNAVENKVLPFFPNGQICLRTYCNPAANVVPSAQAGAGNAPELANKRTKKQTWEAQL
jgi:hypothetical protein